MRLTNKTKTPKFTSTLPRFLGWSTAVIIFLTVAVFIGKNFYPVITPVPGNTTTTITSGVTSVVLTPTAAPPTSAPTEQKSFRVTLTGVGDIILHSAVIEGGLTNPGQKTAIYDYKPVFQYVSSIFKASTLAMANYEGTLAGAPYSGYPFFCAPDAIADALLDAGIRTVWTANNHTIDRGLAGVIRTATIFRDKGFQVIGTRPDESSPADAVVDAGGIKIGLMAYTFETPGTEDTKTLNGNIMPAKADPLIDSFNPYRDTAYTRDMEAMLARAAVLRDQGAELPASS
jgi:hypothetical protein